ncbi:MAG: FMN reductase [Flavobacterium sp. MedPE-SWcel]|uniref:flavodoxin family protein n=1 Tax=uncultured Flavobacterium sp. TaxID=165435 RepID=UPI000911D9EB|nr:NAD(P)H-dependent oxidoreductase [uncultured Flavobacterium sp.]OIQ15609.1 MAG: FMN reductase [Flavobacterium sp. MedPE-SWcel]
MEERKVIIVGSSRSDGNTTRIVNTIAKQNNIDIIDLNDYDFSYFDYKSRNIDDDFLPLIRKVIDSYDTFIFATPIYWYSMSGIMKVFLDRFSDLITIEKETGRKLRGKKAAVISNSSDKEINYDFYMPFRKSSEYLGMEYLGNKHFDAKSSEETINISFI